MVLSVNVLGFVTNKILLKVEYKEKGKEWITIPSLPCASIGETLSFWSMLGFKITYKQTHPYQYGVIERDGAGLHFGHVRGKEAVNYEYSGCLVLVPYVRKVYQEFKVCFNPDYSLGFRSER